MSLSVVILYALTSLPLGGVLFLIIAYQLMIVWLYLVFEIIHLVLSHAVFKTFIDKVNLGAWITATVFATIALDQAEPTLLGFITLLSLTTGLLWLMYLFIMYQWIIQIMKGSRFYSASFFFFGIATTAIAILLDALFHENIALWVYQTIIGLGALLYILSLVYLIKSLRKHSKSILIRWVNTYGFTHGGLAIIGLACVYTQSISEHAILFIWWCVVLFLLLHLAANTFVTLRRLSLIKIISPYQTKQWLSIFNVGVFFGFTFVLNEQLYAHNQLLFLIITYGAYAVIALTTSKIIRLLTYHYQHII